MTKLVSANLFLLLILTVFVILKIPYLNLPFYWDESWVYGPAVTYMSENGPGLLPGSLPVEYGRGHPLLFHFLGGCWGSVFGNTLLSLHIFALTISIALLISIYHITKQIFNVRTALIAVILVCVQPIFFAQSVLVLPEMLLALFMLWALWGYLQNKKAVYLIFASLAILTKESAIVVPLTVMVFETIECIRNKTSFVKWLKSELFLFVPELFFGLILLLNHAYFGWYIFPEHSESISTSFTDIWKKLSDGYFAFLFISQGRNVLSAILILILVTYIFKKWRVEISRPALLFVLFIILFLIFSSFNFYSNRYILLPVILFCALVCNAFTTVNLPVYVGWIFSLIAICVGTIEMKKPNKNDYHPGYAQYVKGQKETVNYCISQGFQHQKITCNFLLKNALTDYRSGYVSKNSQFTHVSPEPMPDTEIIIYGNNEDTSTFSQIASDSGYQLIHKVIIGDSRHSVYRKNN